MQSINDTKFKFNIHLKQASPHKYCSSQSLKIFIGVRSFNHTRLHRRNYFLAVNQKSKRIAGSDFLLSRQTTYAKSLQFAQIQAQQWKAANHHTGAVIVCMRPNSAQRRGA